MIKASTVLASILLGLIMSYTSFILVVDDRDFQDKAAQILCNGILFERPKDGLVGVHFGFPFSYTEQLHYCFDDQGSEIQKDINQIWQFYANAAIYSSAILGIASLARNVIKKNAT